MVFGLFASIGKYFAAFGYLLTGRVDKARERMATDPNVIRATMDGVIDGHKRSISEMMDAVAEIINLQETKKGQKTNFERNLTEKQKIQTSAKRMTEERIRKLQADGKSPEEIKADPEFMRHSSAFSSVSTEVKGLQDNVARATADIALYQTKLDQYKIQLEGMKRGLEKSKEKKSTLVADAITAEQELRLNQMLAGITSDSSAAQTEADLEAAVGKLKAKARVASELAGTDTVVADAQYLAYADKSAAASEFDSLLYGAEKAEDKAKNHVDTPVKAAEVPQLS